MISETSARERQQSNIVFPQQQGESRRALGNPLISQEVEMWNDARNWSLKLCKKLKCEIMQAVETWSVKSFSVKRTRNWNVKFSNFGLPISRIFKQEVGTVILFCMLEVWSGKIGPPDRQIAAGSRQQIRASERPRVPEWKGACRANKQGPVSPKMFVLLPNSIP